MLDIKFKLKESHISARSWMEPSPLRHLFWNVTAACNHRCGICFSASGAERLGELSTDEALALVDQAHEAGVRGFILSGGEPLLRQDMPQILKRMAALGLKVRVATNGTLLTEEMLHFMRDETTVQSFQVSVDTLNPELYAELHGTTPSSHAEALRALERIRDHGFHTTASARLTPQTLEEIPGLLDRAAEEQWATFTVHLPVHTRRTEGASSQETDLLALLEPAVDHFFNMPDHWLIETYIPWAPYHDLMVRASARGRVVHVGCRAGRDRLTVHPSGDLSACVCMDVPAARLGNVRDDRLQDVFEQSPGCDLFQHPAAHGICDDCEQVAVCGGGCRAAAYALTGRMDGLDGSCPVRQERVIHVEEAKQPEQGVTHD
jgi:radical SAM protein with 4Fe4S-binding SPASM domain